MSFFDCCIRCRKTFTDQAAFVAHMQEHKANAAAKEKHSANEAEDGVKAEAAVVPDVNASDDEIDTRLASVRGVNTKRKRLIAAGIEASTMSPKEVEARYEAEKKKGTVK